MEYRVVETPGQKYIECQEEGRGIRRGEDILDLVAACGENETHHLMLHDRNLAEDFYDLKTGAAGSILLKLVNYRIKTAAVLPPERTGQGKFYEMMLETNRGRDFRIFAGREAAEDWLIKG